MGRPRRWRQGLPVRQVQRERPVLRALPAELQSAARAQPSRSGLAGVRRPALVARATIPRSR